MTTLESAAGELLDLASEGRPRPAIDLVLGLLADGVVVDDVIRHVLAPVQLEVGRRWEANLWNAADEHAATAVIDGALGAMALHTPVPGAHRGEVLVGCAEGEHHTMPARMGAQLLRSQGWDVTFLGGSLPADDLQRYAGVTEPQVVIISCTVPVFLPGARRCFTAIAEIGLPTIAAGAAFGSDDERARQLGAGGWMGPASDLESVLDSIEPPLPTAPTPPEVFALELAADDLRRRCLAAMGERIPELSGSSPRQMATTRTEVDDILGYLATSIDLGDDEIFTSFISWQRHMGARRGVHPTVLDRSLDIVGEIVESTGMTEAARLCALHRSPDPLD